jgi:hypothetical protein
MRRFLIASLASGLLLAGSANAGSVVPPHQGQFTGSSNGHRVVFYVNPSHHVISRFRLGKNDIFGQTAYGKDEKGVWGFHYQDDHYIIRGRFSSDGNHAHGSIILLEHSHDAFDATAGTIG